MIAALAESNTLANKRMEQQMALITNLQQTVAELVIRVNDCDSDASTITSSDQKKRRLPHQTSKASIQRLHSSDAGTAGQVNIPPDPGEFNCDLEIHKLQSPDDKAHMQQDEGHDNTPPALDDTQEADDMSQGTENGDAPTKGPNRASAGVTWNVEAPTVNRVIDVNGGIDDDDMIDIMAKEAQAMHTHTTMDPSPTGPSGSRNEKC